MTRPRGENIEYDKLLTRYEALQHQWHDREEFLIQERDRYKAWLYDAWRAHSGQTKGMQRMARRIKRLKEMLVYTEKERVQLDTRVGELLDERLEHIVELAKAHNRIEALKALIHRAHNQFENITVADTLKDAYDMAHHGVAFTDDAAAEPDTMREEYDLTGGERGKFYKREP